MTDSAERAVIGFVGALAIAVFSRGRRALTPGGAAYATVLGTIAAAAGWAWAAMLVAFFVSGTLFSRMSAGAKARHTVGITEKNDERDHVQVLANGGLFGFLALCSVLLDSPSLLVVAAGAIAATTSDTWATEIGTAASATARSIIGLRVVQAGTSGAVSVKGSVAAIAGSVFIAGIALLSGAPGRAAWAAVAGGVAGSIADSVAGATLQSRRWCGQCCMSTERMIHTCGNATTHQRGLRWLNNDGVNALASIGGALAGALFLL